LIMETKLVLRYIASSPPLFLISWLFD
jgi:hypothetical protein